MVMSEQDLQVSVISSYQAVPYPAGACLVRIGA
jgi:hypothetical protein